MKKAHFDRLVDMAKADKEFFHELVFTPDSALEQAAFLSEETKIAIRNLNSKKLFAVLVGELEPERYCDVTCSSSCGFTCGAESCGWTTH